MSSNEDYSQYIGPALKPDGRSVWRVLRSPLCDRSVSVQANVEAVAASDPDERPLEAGQPGDAGQASASTPCCIATIVATAYDRAARVRPAALSCLVARSA